MLSGSPQAVEKLFRHPKVRLSFEDLVLSGAGAERTVDLSAWRGLEADGTKVGVTPVGAGGLQAAFTVSQSGSLAGIAPASSRVPALIVGVTPGQPLTPATLPAA